MNQTASFTAHSSMNGNQATNADNANEKAQAETHEQRCKRRKDEAEAKIKEAEAEKAQAEAEKARADAKAAKDKSENTNYSEVVKNVVQVGTLGIAAATLYYKIKSGNGK